MSSFKVIVVGGGLSGALLANGLLNNNVDFMLYERDEARSEKEGYQIRMGNGAIAGFNACLTSQQSTAIRNKLGKSTSAGLTAPSLYTTQFKELVDFTFVPSYSKSAGINRVVLRDLLLEPVKKTDRLKYGKAFVKYEIITIGGAEKVRVHFADGSSDIGDLLIGADGVHSRINKQLGLNNIVPIDSHWSFVSKGALPYKRMMELPAKLRQGPVLLSSKNTTMYYAFYLPEDFSKHAAHDATTEIEYDEDAASFYWGINIPVDDLPYKDATKIPDKRQVVLNHVKDWAPELQQMLSAGKGDSTTAEVMVLKFYAATKPRAGWRKRCQGSGDVNQGSPRVWLIGDAMHAMQPNRGQGGNQALQDCADILPQILRLDNASKSNKGSIQAEFCAACNAYESMMIPRAFEWVKKSGGTRMPNINFDGWTGTLIQVTAAVLIPILRLYYSIFPGKIETSTL